VQCIAVTMNLFDMMDDCNFNGWNI